MLVHHSAEVVVVGVVFPLGSTTRFYRTGNQAAIIGQALVREKKVHLNPVPEVHVLVPTEEFIKNLAQWRFYTQESF